MFVVCILLEFGVEGMCVEDIMICIVKKFGYSESNSFVINIVI